MQVAFGLDVQVLHSMYVYISVCVEVDVTLGSDIEAVSRIYVYCTFFAQLYVTLTIAMQYHQCLTIVTHQYLMTQCSPDSHQLISTDNIPVIHDD